VKANKDLARMLRSDAEKYLREYDDKDDAEFSALMSRDYAELRRIAAVIEKGDLKRAYSIASKLDTIVRDSISDPIWKAISGDAAFGHEGDDR
jgi:hypothetical protein